MNSEFNTLHLGGFIKVETCPIIPMPLSSLFPTSNWKIVETYMVWSWQPNSSPLSCPWYWESQYWPTSSHCLRKNAAVEGNLEIQKISWLWVEIV